MSGIDSEAIPEFYTCNKHTNYVLGSVSARPYSGHRYVRPHIAFATIFAQLCNVMCVCACVCVCALVEIRTVPARI